MSFARTSATIRGTEFSGLICTDCGTTYARCTAKVLQIGGSACCPGCRNRETHDERAELPKPPSELATLRADLALVRDTLAKRTAAHQRVIDENTQLRATVAACTHCANSQEPHA